MLSINLLVVAVRDVTDCDMARQQLTRPDPFFCPSSVRWHKNRTKNVMLGQSFYLATNLYE